MTVLTIVLMTDLIVSSPAPSLGQLVRPGVGVSQVRSQGQTIQAKVGPVPSGGAAQPGFATVQLPPTLTLRSGTAGPGEDSGRPGGGVVVRVDLMVSCLFQLSCRCHR